MCPNCQAPTRGDADFCTNCGSRVRPPDAAGSAEPTRPAPGQPVRPALPPVAQPPGVASGSPAGSYHFDIQRLAPLDRTVAIASALVLVSLFLPWFGVLGYSISGISLHGYLVLALLVDLALLGYLALRAGWPSMPVRLPIAHAPLLLVGTGAQLFLILIAFLQSDRLGHEFGAYLALLAAIVACAVIAVPVVRAVQAGQRDGSH